MGKAAEAVAGCSQNSVDVSRGMRELLRCIPWGVVSLATR